MGVVYAAGTPLCTTRPRARCCVPRWPITPRPSERFLQEARLINRIRNTNLIDIFDIGEPPDKRLYYVMEFLSGRTLAQVLQDQRLPFAGIVSS